jgi:hypothetical protein
MQLSPHINQQFNAIIWRMEIDELSDTIFLETRNNEDKQVAFSAIKLQTGQVYFKDLTTPERWLTGIEAAHNGVLLLHNYQTETGPTHKGLVAIQASTTDTLWSNYNIAFDHLTVNGPVIYDTRIRPRKLFLADIFTGATIRQFHASIDKALVNNIVMPAMVSPDGLPELVTLQPYGNMVHYLEFDNIRIVSLHALMEGQLNQSLIIMDSDEEVYRDLLNTAIQKMQPEAFIVHKNRLIYIKNKTELKVLTL